PGDDTDDLVGRHHGSAKEKAIVGQLRHRKPSHSAALRASTSSIDIPKRRIMAAIAGISSRWAVGSVVSTAASVAIPTIPVSPGNNNGLPLAARCTSILRCGSDL